MRPLTKMTRQIVSPHSVPSVVRDAFRVATEERPGPVHLELPEDVAGEQVPPVPSIPVHPLERPLAHPDAIDRAAKMIMAARRPLVMIGAAGNRPRLVGPLSDFVRRMGIPFFNTQMGKGAVNGGSNLYVGTAALSERDYVHDAIELSDLIIAIGHDTVEKPPFLMRDEGGQSHPYPSRPRRWSRCSIPMPKWSATSARPCFWRPARRQAQSRCVILSFGRRSAYQRAASMTVSPMRRSES